MEATVSHGILVWYDPAYPKLSEIINYQYLWDALSIDFLYVVRYILLDIH